MINRFGRISAVAAVLCIAAATNAGGQTQAADSGSRFEAATFFGGMIANKELGRGVNATGGEGLVARLNHGAAMGLRGGIHNDLLGLDATFLTSTNRAVVKNEFGTAFPNHAERPLICSADALLYPFRRAIKGGNVRPYLTTGVGGMLLSADLDNISDKEAHGSVVWNAGGGVKVFVREMTGLYLDFRVVNHHFLRSNLQSISVGIGARL